eukprot:478974_1
MFIFFTLIFILFDFIIIIINNLNNNINELSSSHSYDIDNNNINNNNNKVKQYKNQCKEYKHIIYTLQKQLKHSQTIIESERESNKKLNKPKNINIDYLRNVLVKFLILSEYLTDEQIVLIPVLGSILNLTKTEKDMIDNSYNQNVYFMGTNTLFPQNANAKYTPQKKKRRKKKKERDKKNIQEL